MTLLEKIKNLTWYDLINKLKDILTGLDTRIILLEDNASVSGVQSISGDFVDNTDTQNPIINDPRPYKVYSALIKYNSISLLWTNTILENTLGDITWSAGDLGNHTATLSNAFTLNKTFILFGNTGVNTFDIATYCELDESTITVTTTDSSGSPIGGLNFNPTPVEIRVYN